MTGNRSGSGSDLGKVDAHEIRPEEYEELPEWTDEVFERAEFHVGGKRVRRRRPAKQACKEPVTIRLDPDGLAHFRAAGPGWQTRIDAAL